MTASMSIPVTIQIGTDTRPIQVGSISAASTEELHEQMPDFLREVADAYEGAAQQ